MPMTKPATAKGIKEPESIRTAEGQTFNKPEGFVSVSELTTIEGVVEFVEWDPARKPNLPMIDLKLYGTSENVLGKEVHVTLWDEYACRMYQDHMRERLNKWKVSFIGYLVVYKKMCKRGFLCTNTQMHLLLEEPMEKAGITGPVFNRIRKMGISLGLPDCTEETRAKINGQVAARNERLAAMKVGKLAIKEEEDA